MFVPLTLGRKATSEMAEGEVSHGDIYRALGILEGKLDAMNTALTQKHVDMTAAFDRIRALEGTVSKAVGIALACSVVIPLVVTALAPKVHLGGHPNPPAITYPQR